MWPGPWIAIHCDLHTHGPKNVFNDVATNELSIRCSRLNIADPNKPIFDLINRGQVLQMTVQRKVPRF